jgi:hypothetical protein
MATAGSSGARIVAKMYYEHFGLREAPASPETEWRDIPA